MMTDRIDLFATYPHYLDHLLPVFDALPDDRKGNVYVPSDLRPRPRGERIRFGTPPSSDAPLIVAGFQDLRYAHRSKVLLNHGAGQRYANVDSPSYAGGPGREQVGLFLEPNRASADANLARYPTARAAVVGCPLLDGWTKIPAPGDGTIGVAFHWPCHLVTVDDENVPESGWAWLSWRDTIAELAKVRHVLGHGHPRARRHLEAWWAELGVEAVWSPTELLARCDTVVIDNSSFAYEAAACGRGVVLLDDASWRPEVEHGLRFWRDIPGSHLMPSAALKGLLHEIDNVDWHAQHRQKVVERVYGPVDGHASERAAQAILEWEADGCPHPREYARSKPCGC
jgi:hypothetical protein